MKHRITTIIITLALLAAAVSSQTVPPRSPDVQRTRYMAPEATAPVDVTYSTSPFDGVIDNLFGWCFNCDGKAKDQPIYSEGFESHFKPANTMERHGNFTSLDRTVSYRPWGWNVNLVTNDFYAELRMHQLTVFGRDSAIPTMALYSGAGNEQVVFRLPNSATPFSVLAGPGNIYFKANSDQGVFFATSQESSPSNLTRNSVALFLSGAYWDGNTNKGANSLLQTVVTGNNQFFAKLQVGASEYRFHPDGHLQTDSVSVGGTGGPTWTSGNETPAGSCKRGSIYSRLSDGRVFVCRANGWRAVPNL